MRVEVFTTFLGAVLLGRNVYDFNRRVSEGRWQREATFLAFTVVPMYPVAALMDVFVFNPVEFWTRRNPAKDIPGVPANVVRAGASETAGRPPGADERPPGP